MTMGSDPIRRMPSSYMNDDNDVNYVPNNIGISVIGSKGSSDINVTKDMDNKLSFEPGSRNSFQVIMN